MYCLPKPSCLSTSTKTLPRKFIYIYYDSRTPETRTLKGNVKKFELVGNLNYRGKFQ